MDYRVLLAKYMDAVIDRAGVSFADEHDRPGDSYIGMTDEEWAELRRIDEEAESRANTRWQQRLATCAAEGHDFVKQRGYLSEEFPFRCARCGQTSSVTPERWR